MIKKFTFFFYKDFKYSHKIIYAKFHYDSQITYKDIEQISILFIYWTTNSRNITLHTIYNSL